MTAVRWERTPDVLVRRTEDRIFLLPQRSEDPIRLTGTGALIWNVLAYADEQSEIVDAVAEACGEEPASVSDAVVGFLADLEHHGATRSTR